jgi:hypothetical protein
MTTVIPGLERLVVMFPTEVVTVGDVLVAVYRAVRDWIVERHGEFGGSAALKGEANLTVGPSSVSQGEGYINSVHGEIHENYSTAALWVVSALYLSSTSNFKEKKR